VIISRTPFRVSFAGGGTDLRAFYGEEPGAVTSVTIDRYMYITVNRRFDDTLRVSYSRTEIVDDFEKLHHPIVRECLRLTGLTSGLEITSVADMPAGTGVGSSSSFTVGLLHALYAFGGTYASPERLAREACAVEIEILGEPIGKQDQYAAAYGGLQHLRFLPDESVQVDPVICRPETFRELQGSLLFFYTGTVRSASKILSEQRRNTAAKRVHLREMQRQAEKVRDVLHEGTGLERIGALLHEGWMLKQQLAGGISSPAIDGYYQEARRAGALGGKILGAGGGGFLMLYVEPRHQAQVTAALTDLRPIPIGFEREGSKIIFVGDVR